MCDNPTTISSREFDPVIQKLRQFCRNKGMIEACVQQRRSILAACEDPRTISIYNHGGNVWPLPQTGQMQLEVEILQDPEPYGYFTLTTSYRNEPRPVPGRHDLIFPMFEFEIKGDMNELINFEMELLEHLGFDKSTFKSGNWEDVAQRLGVDDIDHAAETRLGQETDVFFLKYFPRKTDPFWNMRMDGEIARKLMLLFVVWKLSDQPKEL